MFRKPESTPESRLKARDDAALIGERIGRANDFIDSSKGQLLAAGVVVGGIVLVGWVEALPM